MRKPLPFVRFYVDDYMADTAHLTTVEHGAHTLIMCAHAQAQEPVHELELPAITKLHGEFESVRDALAELFVISNGYWSHEGVTGEIERQEKKRRNRLKGQAKRPTRGVKRIGRDTGKKWRELRASVFHRDNYTCVYCNAYCESPHCDHIKPLCRGGTNDKENLATACPACNMSKNDKTLEEWRAGR